MDFRVKIDGLLTDPQTNVYMSVDILGCAATNYDNDRISGFNLSLFFYIFPTFLLFPFVFPLSPLFPELGNVLRAGRVTMIGIGIYKMQLRRFRAHTYR